LPVLFDFGCFEEITCLADGHKTAAGVGHISAEEF
jgi:hypothetical protein